MFHFVSYDVSFNVSCLCFILFHMMFHLMFHVYVSFNYEGMKLKINSTSDQLYLTGCTYLNS